MSTWTSERRPGPGPRPLPAAASPAVARFPGRPAALALAVLCLGGCAEGVGPQGLAMAAAGSPAASAPAPAIRVARGAVAIAAPPGYCIDPAGTRDGRGGAFALLGSCAAMTGEGQPPPRRALLTVAVSPPGDGPAVADTLETLTGFFASETGRRLIARSGEAADVTLLSAHVRDSVLYLRLRDESAFDGAEVAAEYWRAVMDVGRHVLSLSAIPLATRPLRPEAALALLEEFATRTRAENAGPRPLPGMLAPPPPRPAGLVRPG